MSQHTQPPAACKLFTKPTTGASNIANCPLRCPQLLGHLPKCGSPTPGPQIARPSKLTSAGVIHVPIIDQHFVKEDNTPITGERLLGEPRRERHQRRHWNPWNRRDEVFTGRWGWGLGSQGLCACPEREPRHFILPSSGKAPRDTNHREPDSLPYQIGSEGS